jgi:hypothetical protein
MRRCCEKSGWGKVLILFCLVNIPTVCDESSQKLGAAAVKKWDKRIVQMMIQSSLPNDAFLSGWFSKTGQRCKRLFMSSMGEISTFQATTVTATKYLSLFCCFLEAVTGVDRK